jgi:hypothetical protein
MDTAFMGIGCCDDKSLFKHLQSRRLHKCPVPNLADLCRLPELRRLVAESVTYSEAKVPYQKKGLRNGISTASQAFFLSVLTKYFLTPVSQNRTP